MEATEKELKCLRCGSVLHYKPGTDHLVCQSCGTENQISSGPVLAIEEDFDAMITKLRSTAITDERSNEIVYKCPDCGAETSRPSSQTSALCPFCGTPQVESTSAQSKRLIPPKYVLPFHIDSRAANDHCRSWISSRWFAPSDLKDLARLDRLQGIYVPAWTFDTSTHSTYYGERGVAYYVTVERNGKRESERRMNWYPVAGQVAHKFDDVVVLASRSLPEKEAHALEPWDFKQLRAFDVAYLSGFRSEAYQVDLPEGFEKACSIMRPELERLARLSIGGDAQRIHSIQTSYSETTYKHLLVPLWISAYRYHGKIYRVLVNARTGEVQGHRPYSWIKITFAVLAGLLALWFILVFYEQSRYGESSYGMRGFSELVPALIEAVAHSL